MGVISFVAAGGGSIGVLLGGVLTDLLDWHWIFLVNIPIGVAVFVFSLRLLPPGPVAAGERRLDLAGAVTVTLALMIAVYAIVNGNETGWTAAQTLGLLALAVALLAAFLVIETRSRSPLMPLALFRLRNIATANIVGVLWAAGCSRGSSCRRSTCSSCSATARWRSASRSCPPTSSWRPSRSRSRPSSSLRFGIKLPLSCGLRRRRARAAALRPRAGRRHLRRRRPAGDDPARLRRRRRVQPAAARSDERRRAAGRRAGLRASSTRPS